MLDSALSLNLLELVDATSQRTRLHMILKCRCSYSHAAICRSSDRPLSCIQVRGRLFCKEHFLGDPSSIKTACICVALIYLGGANYFPTLEPSPRSPIFQDRIIVLGSIEISYGSETSTMENYLTSATTMSSVESGYRCAIIPSSHRSEIMNRRLDQGPVFFIL